MLDSRQLHSLALRSLKRSRDIFVANQAGELGDDSLARQSKISAKKAAEYSHVSHLDPPKAQRPAKRPRAGSKAKINIEEESDEDPTTKAVASVQKREVPQSKANQAALVLFEEAQKAPKLSLTTYQRYAKPTWHAPWKLKAVIASHVGAVRCIDVEPGNEWFATGAADRTIKLFDMATHTLKLTLTGHIATVRDLVISQRHPYLFSCGEDRQIKCWDLESNKVIRHYYGHLNGIYSMAIHPKLDILITGGRDSTARVWDMRSKSEIHVLTGHEGLVASILAQASDPQVTTGSSDSTIRTWDMRTGKTLSILTNHKKSVRALAQHPEEFTFVSGAADNIKKWAYPKGEFLSNLSGHNSIVNTLAVNDDNVLISGGDNGSIKLWDYATGYNFQTMQTQVQPGSLESEAGIFASTFDRSGSRFLTCEADKTIKIWAEDENASPDSHPIDPSWRPSRALNRF